MDPALSIALALLIAAATAAALAWLLRGAGIAGGRPAAAIVGGLLAGILLGPAVLGHIAPHAFETIFRGGVPERDDLRQTLARHRADLAAATVAGPAPGALAEVFARHNAERAPLERNLNRALAEHRRALAGAAAAILALAMLLSACASRPLTLDPRTPLLALIALAAELALIGGLMWLVLRAPPHLAVAAAIAGAGGSVFAGIPFRWVPARGRAPTARAAGALMYLLAGAVLLAIAPAGGRTIAAALLAAPLLGWTLRLALPGRRTRSLRRITRAALLWVALPTAAAVAALHIEWEILGDDPRALAAVPLLLLLSGNGAFAGLCAGWRLSAPPLSRPAPAETVLDWLAAGYGPTQTCLTLALLAAGAADPLTPLGSAVLAGLLLSAAIGETTLAWMRHTLARLPDAHRYEPPVD